MSFTEDCYDCDYFKENKSLKDKLDKDRIVGILEKFFKITIEPPLKDGDMTIYETIAKEIIGE